MLEFKPIKIEEIPIYAKFYKGSGVCICEKTLSCKSIWKILQSEIAVSHDCLIIKNNYPGMGITFDYPLPAEGGDTEAALGEIEGYCLKNGIKLCFSALRRKEMAMLAKRFPFFKTRINRNYSDYIYSGEDMRSFSGKKYAGQRNHINKFLSKYPQAKFRKLENFEKETVLKFMNEWKKTVLPTKINSAKNEFKLILSFVSSINFDDYCTGCVEVEGKIIAVSFAEKVFDTLVIHVEKALHNYEGVNVFMVREFANFYNTPYINREDDSGVEGLRISKMQYKPIYLADKYFMQIENELSMLKSVPTIKTENLTLSGIKRTDAEEYYALCVDENLNKYWGYDYKKDLKGELYTEYFYDVAKRDEKNKTCLNFALKLDGKFIGETVLFEFDNHGTCKLGVRILPEFGGHGYGKEAFYGTMKWALYGLGMRKIKSSCYKENYPSLKLHRELMRQTGEDNERFYFEREY